MSAAELHKILDPVCASVLWTRQRDDDFYLRHGLNASWHSKATHLSVLDRPRICLTPNSGDDGLLQQV